jgi:hypothetical protein
LGGSVLSRIDVFCKGLGCVAGRSLHRAGALVDGLGRVAGDLLHGKCALCSGLNCVRRSAFVEEQINAAPGCFGRGITRLVGCHR